MLFRSGKGFICIHISGSLPEAWQEYHDITGGGWILGTSLNPPDGKVNVDVTNPEHAGDEGV